MPDKGLNLLVHKDFLQLMEKINKQPNRKIAEA